MNKKQKKNRKYTESINRSICEKETRMVNTYEYVHEDMLNLIINYITAT